MQADATFWVVIPASGTGARFNHSLPKQYWSLAGKTILVHSLGRFLNKPWVNQVVVATAAADQYFAKVCPTHPKLTQVVGGQTRSHSVMNALRYIEQHGQSHDWVLVHDAVRPCLHEEDLQALLQLRYDPVGGILAAPVSDTLKKVSSSNQINETVPREALWAAQTPQMFRLHLLIEALCKAHEVGYSVTDESSAVEALGYRPHIVPAQHPNPKLTYAADLSYIELLLAHNIEAVIE